MFSYEVIGKGQVQRNTDSTVHMYQAKGISNTSPLVGID